MAARILIIEDNPGNLELMRYVLKAFKYEVMTAEDGEQGVGIAEREAPDLILCDIQLPGIDGIEVLRRIRGIPGLARTAVVAVTALAMVGDRDRILASGFDGYVSKAIDPSDFVAQVESFLKQEMRTTPLSPAAESTRSPAPRTVVGRTILAVDNQQSNLDLLSSIFGNIGYRVVTTLTARETLQLAREISPDVILSDVCMPVGSGYDLIREIKADPVLRTVPFVFITSTAATENERRAGLKLGAAKYLFRPIEPQELIAEIESCFEPGGG